MKSKRLFSLVTACVVTATFCCGNNPVSAAKDPPPEQTKKEEDGASASPQETTAAAAYAVAGEPVEFDADPVAATPHPRECPLVSLKQIGRIEEQAEQSSTDQTNSEKNPTSAEGFDPGVPKTRKVLNSPAEADGGVNSTGEWREEVSDGGPATENEEPQGQPSWPWAGEMVTASAVLAAEMARAMTGPVVREIQAEYTDGAELYDLAQLNGQFLAEAAAELEQAARRSLIFPAPPRELFCGIESFGESPNLQDDPAPTSALDLGLAGTARTVPFGAAPIGAAAKTKHKATIGDAVLVPKSVLSPNSLWLAADYVYERGNGENVRLEDQPAVEQGGLPPMKHPGNPANDNPQEESVYSVERTDKSTVAATKTLPTSSWGPSAEDTYVNSTKAETTSENPAVSVAVFTEVEGASSPGEPLTLNPQQASFSAEEADGSQRCLSSKEAAAYAALKARTLDASKTAVPPLYWWPPKQTKSSEDEEWFRALRSRVSEAAKVAVVQAAATAKQNAVVPKEEPATAETSTEALVGCSCTALLAAESKQTAASLDVDFDSSAQSVTAKSNAEVASNSAAIQSNTNANEPIAQSATGPLVGGTPALADSDRAERLAAWQARSKARWARIQAEKKPGTVYQAGKGWVPSKRAPKDDSVPAVRNPVGSTDAMMARQEANRAAFSVNEALTGVPTPATLNSAATSPIPSAAGPTPLAAPVVVGDSSSFLSPAAPVSEPTKPKQQAFPRKVDASANLASDSLAGEVTTTSSTPSGIQRVEASVVAGDSASIELNNPGNKPITTTLAADEKESTFGPAIERDSSSYLSAPPLSYPMDAAIYCKLSSDGAAAMATTTTVGGKGVLPARIEKSKDASAIGSGAADKQLAAVERALGFRVHPGETTNSAGATETALATSRVGAAAGLGGPDAVDSNTNRAEVHGKYAPVPRESCRSMEERASDVFGDSQQAAISLVGGQPATCSAPEAADSGGEETSFELSGGAGDKRSGATKGQLTKVIERTATVDVPSLFEASSVKNSTNSCLAPTNAAQTAASVATTTNDAEDSDTSFSAVMRQREDPLWFGWRNAVELRALARGTGCREGEPSRGRASTPFVGISPLGRSSDGDAARTEQKATGLSRTQAGILEADANTQFYVAHAIPTAKEAFSILAKKARELCGEAQQNRPTPDFFARSNEHTYQSATTHNAEKLGFSLQSEGPELAQTEALRLTLRWLLSSHESTAAPRWNATHKDVFGASFLGFRPAAGPQASNPCQTKSLVAPSEGAGRVTKAEAGLAINAPTSGVYWHFGCTNINATASHSDAPSFWIKPFGSLLPPTVVSSNSERGTAGLQALIGLRGKELAGQKKTVDADGHDGNPNRRQMTRIDPLAVIQEMAVDRWQPAATERGVVVGSEEKQEAVFSHLCTPPQLAEAGYRTTIIEPKPQLAVCDSFSFATSLRSSTELESQSHSFVWESAGKGTDQRVIPVANASVTAKKEQEQEKSQTTTQTIATGPAMQQAPLLATESDAVRRVCERHPDQAAQIRANRARFRAAREAARAGQRTRT
ncbi:MAG: hypothetical protein LBJ38_02290 [Oscillospiraceae bacterium]|jgi:hypothetical protein|nr:hypothetical protein [Oscillospiraceae bacterium]